MFFKKIFISKFKKQIPNLKEFHKGEILINYEKKQMVSQAWFESKNTKNEHINQTNDLDEESETFFEGFLLQAKSLFDTINAVKITIEPNNISATAYGVKDFKKIFRNIEL